MQGLSLIHISSTFAGGESKPALLLRLRRRLTPVPTRGCSRTALHLGEPDPTDLPLPQEARTPVLDQALPLHGVSVASAALPLFAGRQRELDLIYGHVAGPQRGHVAVSGPLGIGKTRLLRQVADPRMVASVSYTHLDVYKRQG